MDKQLSLAGARTLVDGGAVTSVELVGFPGGWTVRLHTRGKPAILAAKRGGPREFATFEAAARVLKRLGVRMDALKVDASRWESAGLLSAKRRPDRSEALRKAHAASAELESMRVMPGGGDDPAQDTQPA